MSYSEIFLTLAVAIIGSSGGTFAFLQFWLKRKDEKEEKSVHSLIADAVKKAKEDMHQELEEGLIKRGEEGKERFEINSKQIQKNAETADKILQIQESQVKKVDAMMESLTSLNLVTKACAEGVKSTLFDKIQLIAEKAIARQGITTAEKANVEQLWESYKALDGNGEGKAYAETCLHTLPMLSKQEADLRDHKGA